MRAYLCLLASVAAFVACSSGDDSSTTNGSNPTTSSVGNAPTPTNTSGSVSSSVTTDAGAGVTGAVDPSTVSSGSVATPPPPDDVTMTSGSTMYAGVTRNYLLGTPRNYDASKSYPLVMLFHGNPGSKEEMRALIPFESVTQTSAILVYPDAIGGAWDLYTPTDSNNDLSFIHALPGILAANLNIDKTKIFGFGFSGGSFFLTQFTCVFGDLFRAVAINSGGGPVEQELGYPQRADGCYICPAGPTSSLVVHGDADTTVAYQSGAYTAQCLSETDTCASTTTPAAASPCVTYDACTGGKPLEWCLIPGLNHAPWDNAQTEAWRFFNAAP